MRRCDALQMRLDAKGCTFGTHSLLYCATPAQLRKSGVVMGRHATSWLSADAAIAVARGLRYW
ncbi:MAG: hypothetical protein ACI4BC_06725 [Muribaculaceae bacterium]